MKRFSEFLREQQMKVPGSEIEEVDVVPTPQESEQKLEKNWSKITKDFQKGLKKPSYSGIKKMIQGDKETSKGAVDLDLTPKPEVNPPMEASQPAETIK